MGYVEPYVKVTDVIKEGQSLATLSNDSVLGGVIVSPAGPKLTRVNGPAEFLKTYTKDGSIPRNAHRSMLNAYYCSFFAPLVIARAMNSSLVPGLAFKYNTSNKQYKYVCNLSTDLNTTGWIIEYDDVYYYYLGSSINLSALLTELTSGPDATDMVTKYEVNSITEFSNLIGATYSVNTNILVVNSSDDPTFTVYGGALDQIGSGEVKTTFESSPVNFKDGQLMDRRKSITIASGDDKVSVLNGICYYRKNADLTNYANYPQVKVTDDSDIINSINGTQGYAILTDSSTEYITYNQSSTPSLISGTGLISLGSEESPYSSLTNIVLYAMLSQPTEGDSDTASDYSLQFDPIEGTTTMLMTFKTPTSMNQFYVSLDQEGVDQSGINCYIENLNQSDLGITFNVVDTITTDDIEEIQSSVLVKFMGTGLSMSASSEDNVIISSLSTLENQEVYRLMGLCSFGVVKQSIQKAYVTLSASKKWFYPIETPETCLNTTSIKNHFNAIQESGNAIAVGPMDQNTSLVGWKFYLGAGCLYWERVFANKAIGNEFAGTYEVTNGVFNYTNPVITLSSTERELLLNAKYPINFAKYDTTESVYVLNDNRTFKRKNLVDSEDQNRRLINKMDQDLAAMYKGYKGQLNTEPLRSSITKNTETYIKTTYGSLLTNPIEDYRVICDSSNNTDAVIAANKLAVTVQIKLYGSIKYIDVINEVYPLDVDFE